MLKMGRTDTGSGQLFSNSVCHKVIMPERKVWTEQEDRVLRLLREGRGERKWANIARIMEQEFGIAGRTGKQCRQRFHNHLDAAIVSSEWTIAEQRILFELHEELGNKWSISQKLPGRSDNCVKNHFYSKLRKALRKLNKINHQYFEDEYKQLRESVLSRLIKTIESKFKTSSKIDQELAEFCNEIKNRLFNFEFEEEENIEDVENARKLIIDIERFDKDYKKGYKGIKNEFQYQYKTYLKPPPKILKKNQSTHSCSSQKSQDSCYSFLSSNSYFSSSDLDQYQHLDDSGKFQNLAGNKSLGTTSGRNSSDISKSEKIEEKRDETFERSHEGFLEKKEQMYCQMKPQTFQREYQQLIEVESNFYNNNYQQEMHYDNIIEDDTPIIGRILGPKACESPFNLFKNQNYDNQQIQFKFEKMEL